MHVSPNRVEGVRLLAPGTAEFEAAFLQLLGRASRALVAPAEPFSVIVENGAERALSFLAVRFNMLSPHGKACSVVHYADSLRNPEQSDFLPGLHRFVCAEPGYTSLLLRQEDSAHTTARMNLQNLRGMRHIEASIDCVAFDDGRFSGKDSLGAFERLAEERAAELKFLTAVLESGSAEFIGEAAVSAGAIDSAANRARRSVARKLLEAFEAGGETAMRERAQAHRTRIAVFR